MPGKPEALPSVLIVDDEESQRNIIADILRREGYQTFRAGSVEEGVRSFRENGPEIVLTDLKMPGGSGIDLLVQVKKLDQEVEVILMTAYGTIQTAVEAMKKGACDYLQKPFEKDELKIVVAKAWEGKCLKSETRDLKRQLQERFRFQNLIGSSPAMQEIYHVMERVLSNSITVLIRGASGTGKELVARAIHFNGIRKEGSFVAVNCAAIPAELIESELFGHEKGAFTGATRMKIGKFEEANGGTLFLDEIGCMRVDLQVKFLRVIQEMEFTRVGGSEMIRSDARIVAATSEDLEKSISDGRFREDLFFRLNVLPIQLPLLRDRKEDIPLLARHFLERFGKQFEREPPGLSGDAIDLMAEYRWPGNVRELQNTIQRMMVLSDSSTLGVDDLPGNLREPPPASDGAGLQLPESGVSLESLEEDFIRQALLRTGGKLDPAARLLGISYKTLQYRIRKYGIQGSS
ncbi:MAG: sigma-54 dependent transcriptional regulator [Planctomycetota bacterium]|nr:sigma-54 dependent transcriptional regulator [Planctomycetota bacterium]